MYRKTFKLIVNLAASAFIVWSNSIHTNQFYRPFARKNKRTKSFAKKNQLKRRKKKQVQNV